jgi:hypothetical protein
LRFGAAPRGERAATLRLMARVTIGDRHESNAVAKGRILSRDAAGALIAVVRVRAKRDNIELAVRTRRLGASWLRLLAWGAGPDRTRAGCGENRHEHKDEHSPSLHKTSVAVLR